MITISKAILTSMMLAIALLVIMPAGFARTGALPEDPGPHAPGWRDVTFQDDLYGQGTISARIYYPALAPGQNQPPDPVSGPYPLVGFLHGWLLDPDDYDDLCNHMATWGFLVASTGTETGLFPNHAQFARDTRSLLAWIDAESQDPTSWLEAMAAPGEWAAVGHSMGGGTLNLLIGIETRVRLTLGLQPASEGEPAISNLKSFTGRAFQVSGTDDWIVPPAVVRAWFDGAPAAARNFYFECQGIGHSGCTDNPDALGGSLPGSEQARIHRRLVAGILRAELKDEENLYVDVVGEGMAPEPVHRESNCSSPPYWTRMSAFQPNDLVAGLGGSPSGRALFLLALVPASIPTPYGMLGLDPSSLFLYGDLPLTAEGWTETGLKLPKAASGMVLHLQGGLFFSNGSGVLTRCTEVLVP